MKKTDQQKQDETLLNQLSDTVGPKAYREHMRQKTAGIQVDVVEAYTTRRSSTPRYAIAGAIASIATVLLVIFSPFSENTSETVAPPIGMIEATEATSDEMANVYLEDLISEQTIESLIETTTPAGSGTVKSASTLLTDSDIDALLAEL